MSRRKQRTRLDLIAEALKLAPDLGPDQRQEALKELIDAREALITLVEDVKAGTYPS